MRALIFFGRLLLYIIFVLSGCTKTSEVNQCATPTFSPGEGTYTSSQNITISCATINSTIVYTTNGSNPNSNSLVYSGPITVPTNTIMVIKAQAYREGWSDSKVASADFIVTGTVSGPVFNPPNGVYHSEQNVILSCSTSEAIIHYTTDGSIPDSSSSIYTTPLMITSSTNVMAIAIKQEWLGSNVTSSYYSLQPTTPTFSPSGGSYSPSQVVTMTCSTSGVSIHFTTDGSEPSETSNIYSGPITIISNTTVKAKAYKPGWIESQTASSIYTIYPTIDQFIFVPGGTFTMGRTTGTGETDELPTHSVSLPPYYIGKYEVTQNEWQVIMGTNPANGYGVGGNYPVYYVSWYSVIKYCNLRSIAQGLTPVYTINGSTDPTDWGDVPMYFDTTWNEVICNWSANGYRLPTEAEWEYAARGATNNPDYLYSGSNDINSVAWYDTDSSHPVGQKQANGLGIFDMSGNVGECCWDWYNSSYYSQSPSYHPKGPSNGSDKIMRGGYWSFLASSCRVADRGIGVSTWYNNYEISGFRLCRSTFTRH